MAARCFTQPCVILSVILLYLCESARSEYYPVYGNGYSVFYNASTDYKRYPDVHQIIPDAYEYFLSPLNFDVVEGNLICGAADKLYVLTTSDLTVTASLSWEPEASKKTECEGDMTELASYNCRNHIRVHQSIPTVTDDDLLMVCGTQATMTPQCRVVKVTTEGQTTTLQSFTTVDASEGIVSYYPDFSQFGQFRNDSSTDTTFFTAGFFEGGSGIGRHFSISYQEITVGDSNTLTTTERFRTINANNNWLRYPVTFVDFMSLDYEPPALNGNEDDYLFYFAFIRENLYSAASSSDGIIQSRVVRICRNDQGYVNDDPNSSEMPYFTTYMKARIFCERQLETGDQFDGGIKYLYNELRSVAFTDGGRHYGDSDYGKKLYGAFTGPIVGPHGTAICVYSGENTENSGNGRSQSMFDIFREDLQSPEGSQVENNFVRCDPDGRNEVTAQNILVNEEKFVMQLESDPLLVMDGLFVNQMVLDEQCVVRLDDTSKCTNQDILFLGTDNGKVFKVVFASGKFPVVSEELSFDDDNNIQKMVIHDDGEGSERFLFVNTHSKIYKLPLARCGRHQTCLDCVSARDPYCVWDGDVNMCIPNPFTTTQNEDTIDSNRYKQNIHTGDGSNAECMAEPDCNLITSSLAYNVIQVAVDCTNTDQIEISITPADGLTVTNPTHTLSGGTGTGSTTITGSDGFQSYTVSATATQTGNNGETVLTSVVTTPPGPPLSVSADEILIHDVTTTSFQVTIHITKFTDSFTEYSFQIQGNVNTEYQPFTTSTSYTVTNRSPATDYTFTVSVRNSIAMVMTEEISVRTLDDVPGGIDVLTAMSFERRVDLSWDPPQSNGVIVGYVVRVDGVELRGCGGWGGSVGENYNVTGLTPSTEYQFSVAACTSAGVGISAGRTVTTLCSSPEAVTALQISAVSEETLQYSWSPPTVPNTPLTSLGYMVRITCFTETGVVSTRPTFNVGDVTMGTIDSLSPLTLCCVQVAAISSCPGEPTLSGPLTETCGVTNDTIPGGVTSLTVTGVNREGILITWNPPDNYARSGLEYRVTVSASNFVTIETTLYDQAYYYLGGLEASKEFSVSVLAMTGLGGDSSVQAVGSTLPDPPDPPSNPTLSVVDDNDNVTLELSWQPVETATEYIAVLRCNEEDPIVKNTTSTSTTFTVTDPEERFAWCTSQVQSKNDVGLGQFSELVSIALPTSAPSTPRCFLVDDQGSAIFISFDVTHPFSLNSLLIKYKNIPDFQDANSVDEIVKQFTSTNVLSVNVSRKTHYEFQLRLCNSHGCSEYCDQLMNFTTSSTAPRPPSDITVTDLTYNFVSLSWSVPEFENPSTIKYMIQVSGTGNGAGTYKQDGSETTLDLKELDAETMYTVAIQVQDTLTNTDGVFGPAKSFTTEIGTPSAPSALEAKWIAAQQELTVSWSRPVTTNGTIRQYELLYSGSITKECDDPGDDVVTISDLEPTTRTFETNNTSYIIETKSFLVCVRAYTDRPGTWAQYLQLDVDISGLTNTNSGSESDCSGLIAVAVVAALAIVSTVVAVVILCLVVRQYNNNRIMDQKTSHSSINGNGKSRDRQSPAPSTDTGFEEQQHHQRPQLNSMQSIDSNYSTASTKPFLHQHSNGN